MSQTCVKTATVEAKTNGRSSGVVHHILSQTDLGSDSEAANRLDTAEESSMRFGWKMHIMSYNASAMLEPLSEATNTGRRKR